jgi:hypothetical protein
VVPSVNVLLPDKKEDNYCRMFDALKSLKPNLNPKTILIDYEKAAINAIKTVFPSTKVNGCFFYLSQCMWSHV